MALSKFTDWYNEQDQPSDGGQHITDVAKHNVAHTHYGKFVQSLASLRQDQWEIYLSDLMQQFQTKWRKNFTALKAIDKGSSIGMKHAMDKMNQNVPVAGGNVPAGGDVAQRTAAMVDAATQQG